jgi:hypothetical protein
MSESPSSFEDLLGQTTPYAPATEDEERERLRAGAARTRSPDDDPLTPDDSAPAYVYVPTRPYRQDEDFEIRLELHSIGPDEAGLAVFTTEELLTEHLGEFQPCAKFATLDLFVQIAPAGIRVLVNPDVAPGTELWTEDTVRSWSEQHPPTAHGKGA